MYRKVLIIKPGAIGDLLQITPVLRALHTHFRSAEITMLVGSPETASLFAHHPLVVETIVFDRRGEHKSLKALAQLWSRIRKNRFDLVLHYQRSNLKAWFLASAAMPCHISVYHKSRTRGIHAVTNHLEPLRRLGIDPGLLLPRLEFYPGEEAERFADGLFRSHGIEGETVIALNPGASHKVNRWSVERFALLTDRIAMRGETRVVLIGGEDDKELSRTILGLAASRPIDLAGRTTLLQLGSVLRRCAVLVTGDTGPMHVATAVGTRVVALFGAADPERTGPVGIGHRVLQARDVACVPCRSRKCTHTVYLECMERISVDAVHEAVLDVIEPGKGAGPRG